MSRFPLSLTSILPQLLPHSLLMLQFLCCCRLCPSCLCSSCLCRCPSSLCCSPCCLCRCPSCLCWTRCCPRIHWIRIRICPSCLPNIGCSCSCCFCLSCHIKQRLKTTFSEDI